MKEQSLPTRVRLVLGIFGDDFTSDPMPLSELPPTLGVILNSSVYGDGQIDIRIIPE